MNARYIVCKYGIWSNEDNCVLHMIVKNSMSVRRTINHLKGMHAPLASIVYLLKLCLFVFLICPLDSKVNSKCEKDDLLEPCCRNANLHSF